MRKSLGEALTEEEESRLAVWYAEQDQAEAALLGLAPESSELDAIKRQVDTILGRIATTSQSIQALAAENETLRRENTALRWQLAERPIIQLSPAEPSWLGCMKDTGKIAGDIVSPAESIEAWEVLS